MVCVVCSLADGVHWQPGASFHHPTHGAHPHRHSPLLSLTDGSKTGELDIPMLEADRACYTPSTREVPLELGDWNWNWEVGFVFPSALVVTVPILQLHRPKKPES